MSNFNFLKKINTNLYKTIIEAEKLFRDEYFEQVTVQVRKFAENLARDLLKDNIEENITFDGIIQKIKDNSFENIRKKEFVEDLYFIKNNGNKSAHSTSNNSSAEIALECLERAFEISIFYSHNKVGFDEKLDKTLFSEELLMLEEKTSKDNLKSRYKKALDVERLIEKEKPVKKLKTKLKKVNKQAKETLKTQKYPKNSASNYVKIIFIILLFSCCTILLFFVLKTLGMLP